MRYFDCIKHLLHVVWGEEWLSHSTPANVKAAPRQQDSKSANYPPTSQKTAEIVCLSAFIIYCLCIAYDIRLIVIVATAV